MQWSPAPPGASEHQTGLALDVSCQAVDYKLDERFGETREGLWLKRYAPLFGFILRYSKRKRAYYRVWVGTLAYPVCNQVIGVVSDTYGTDTERVL